MKTSLIALPGAADPFRAAPQADREITGPVLSALAARDFQQLILIGCVPHLVEAIRERYPKLDIHLVQATEDLQLEPESNALLLIDQPAPIILPLLNAIATGALAAEPVRLLSGAPGTQPVLEPVAWTGAPGIPAGIVREPTGAYRTRNDTGRIGFRPARNIDPESAIRELGLIGQDPGFLKMLNGCCTMAQHDIPILVQGETGTGKDLIARLIHRLSPRCREPFIPVNCAALPEQLVESILFGHRRGAFTGAQTDQTGKFELAHGGTLFLDELGELPMALQSKLLRVLEDGIIEPLGAKSTKQVDVRLIAATNLDLGSAIRDKTFREDLYYRLAAGLVRLPALRERRDDIPLLALAILDQMNATLAEPRQLATEALERLRGREWPGNVRDLQNTLSRSVLWSAEQTLQADDLLLDDPILGSDDPHVHLPAPEEGFSLETYLASVRKQLFLKAIDLAHGNQSNAAKRLGVSPQAVHKFLKSQD